MQRRRYLTAVGAGLSLGIAGCSSILADQSFERAEQGFSEDRDVQATGTGSATVTMEVVLPEGTYDYTLWDPSRSVSAQYELFFEENPGEFFLIDRRELSRFREAESIQHYVGFHDTGRVCSGGGRLNAGDYYLVADNTTYGEQSPAGDLHGELELAVGV